MCRESWEDYKENHNPENIRTLDAAITEAQNTCKEVIEKSLSLDKHISAVKVEMAVKATDKMAETLKTLEEQKLKLVKHEIKLHRLLIELIEKRHTLS